MSLVSRSTFATFGWSIGCAGRKPSQVRDDVRATVDWAKDVWRNYFPADLGYVVEATSPAGPSNGVQLAVSRGDFRAIMVVESILDPSRKSPGARAVRLYGRAESGALTQAERWGHELVERARTIGFGTGLGFFALVCWWIVGVSVPTVVLAGLLMIVIALLSVAALGAFGTYVGEQLAASGRARALAETAGDARLHEDVRRWGSLVRQLSNKRNALTGDVGRAPFRALPPSSREVSQPLARVATSAFSFSS